MSRDPLYKVKFFGMSCAVEVWTTCASEDLDEIVQDAVSEATNDSLDVDPKVFDNILIVNMDTKEEIEYSLDGPDREHSSIG